MSPEKKIAIGFLITFSENPGKIQDSTHSPADVDHLISKRIEYAKTQKAGNLTKEPHVNITSNTSSHNYESVNAGLELTHSHNYESVNTGLKLTQESVDTEIIEDSDSDSEEEIQILDLDECEMIDELNFRELEQIPHVTVKLTEGQVLEEFMIEEEIFVRSFPELHQAQKGIHKDDIQLEIPKVNTIEINELPKEIKLEIPLEQGK